MMATEEGGIASRSYRVSGRVQGVGFRWWTQRAAEELELVGSVRNLLDGSVEVRASGSPARLAELETRLRGGPPYARVDDVETREGGVVADPPSRFRIVQ